MTWLGHENWCSIQWSPICDCGDEPMDLSESPPEACSIPERSAMPGDPIPPLPPCAYPPEAIPLPREHPYERVLAPDELED